MIFIKQKPKAKIKIIKIFGVDVILYSDMCKISTNNKELSERIFKYIMEEGLNNIII